MSETNEKADLATVKRTHFKIGSRKSKLAMVQSEYVADQLKQKFPMYTFEIINFDTKGDQILNVALPKIGDKGLFTKELEDGLNNRSIDFVVHSLKDLPCQTSPENLVIAGIPERENPYDALVMAKRWQGKKFTLDDLEPSSTIGTSSYRRISQIKQRYPQFKFETIRGNLQTRLAKLDDEKEKKFDAIILAAAGLKRMNYESRITEILPSSVCMHAVSQGALGIQCRQNDLPVIRMLNELNHEETLLRCVAERTFLAKLEGGCSTPIGVSSVVTEKSIHMEGTVLDLDGTQRLDGRFEIDFNNESNCPLFPVINKEQKEFLLNAIKAESSDEATAAAAAAASKKKQENEQQEEDDESHGHNTKSRNKRKSIEEPLKSPTKRLRAPKSKEDEEATANKAYAFIVDLNIDKNKLIKSELCGFHLAEKLKEMGAEKIINEVKASVALPGAAAAPAPALKSN